MNVRKIFDGLLIQLEENGLIKRTPGFLHDYEKQYPYFQELEKNHDIIKKECEILLNHINQLHNVEGMAGKNSKGGIHTAQWKSFMFKAGSFIEENCAHCPETSRMLKRIPGIKQAFFSILYPNQYIKPHRGYFYGFLRYHLGIIIPDNNINQQSWLRVNDDQADNKKNKKKSIVNGVKYFWKEGKGIMFNDNYLHDAANESDKIRVILWLDVVRKFPAWINWLVSLSLFVAYRSRTVRKIAKDAVVKGLTKHNKQ